MVKFDEFLNDNGEWVEAIVSSKDWASYKQYDYGKYTIYNCWDDNPDRVYIFRVKNKKVCKECGQEIKDE